MIGNSTYPNVVAARNQTTTTDELRYNSNKENEEDVSYLSQLESGSLEGIVDMTRTKSVADPSLNRQYPSTFTQRAPASISTNLLGLSGSNLAQRVHSPVDVVSAPLSGASTEPFLPSRSETILPSDLMCRDANIWTLDTNRNNHVSERISDSLISLEDLSIADDKSAIAPPQFNGEFLFEDDHLFEASRAKKFLSSGIGADSKADRTTSFMPRRATLNGPLLSNVINQSDSLPVSGWTDPSSSSNSSSSTLIDHPLSISNGSLPYNIRRSQGSFGHIIRPSSSERVSDSSSLSRSGTASSSFSSPDLSSAIRHMHPSQMLDEFSNQNGTTSSTGTYQPAANLAPNMTSLRMNPNPTHSIGSQLQSSFLGDLNQGKVKPSSSQPPQSSLPFLAFQAPRGQTSSRNNSLNSNPNPGSISTNGPMQSIPAGICRYFLQGYCSRGDKCHFSHSLDLNGFNALQAAQNLINPLTLTNQAAALNYAASLNMMNGMNPATAAMAAMAAGLYQQHANMMNMLYSNTPGSTKPTTSASMPSFSASLPVASQPGVPTSMASASSLGLTGPSMNGLRGYMNAVPNQPKKKQTPDEVNRFVNVELEDLVGQIYPVSKDQHGCRFLQRKIEEGEEKYIDMIYVEVITHFAELMTDPFGNYLCQKLFEHCKDDQKTKILEQISPDLVNVSLNLHGTRAVQKLIDYMTVSDQILSIVRALSGHVVQLIKDLNGNHVIQKCLYRLSPEHNQFIYDSVTESCIEVATHRHGCCVLQRCIDHASDAQKRQLVDEITANALTLVQDPFGNYVVQYVLDLGNPTFSSLLTNTFIGHVCNLSVQKFSSNVIEKCIRVAEPQTRTHLIEELLDKDKLDKLLRDSFANYVIQTSLDYAAPEQRERLIQCIRPILPAIRHTPYGKRIQSKLMSRAMGGPGGPMMMPGSLTNNGQAPHLSSQRIFHNQDLMNIPGSQLGYKQQARIMDGSHYNSMMPNGIFQPISTYNNSMNSYSSGMTSMSTSSSGRMDGFRAPVPALSQQWISSSVADVPAGSDPLRMTKSNLSEGGMGRPSSSKGLLDTASSMGFPFGNPYM